MFPLLHSPTHMLALGVQTIDTLDSLQQARALGTAQHPAAAAREHPLVSARAAGMFC